MSHKYWASKAMSFPSEGRTAMFRNPMTEVSKFMKQKVRINFKNQGSWNNVVVHGALKIIQWIRESIRNIFMFGISALNEAMKHIGLKIDADDYWLTIIMSQN